MLAEGKLKNVLAGEGIRPIALPCSGCSANSIQSNSISPKLFCCCLSSCSLSELGVGDKLSINPT